MLSSPAVSQPEKVMSAHFLAKKRDVAVFSTCPQSIAVSRESYLSNVIEVARWSEEAGCEGILVYADNSLVDPWMVAQIIIQNTKRLCPLVAVQPAYMHPYSVAKMVGTLGHLYGRKVYLNMVASGLKNDLAALNDSTPYDKRYARLVEYTTIIQELLQSPSFLTYHGEFYTVEKLRMTPALDPELIPGIFVSGSSDAGLAAATALGATAIKYPQPADSEPGDSRSSGIRVGVVARANDDDAWRVAEERFPGDRKDQLPNPLKMPDSQWNHRLLHVERSTNCENGPYWLWPFENYQTFCPYLVGSYERVAVEFSKYIARGFSTFILDIPPAQEEIKHVGEVFSQARQLVTK